MHDIEEKIYREYHDVIIPFIVMLEVFDTEFPVEVLNEIRSIFTHLSRYKLDNNEYQLQLALGHVKRAILDCQKYFYVSIEEKIKYFRMEYQNIDLSVADNGNFLPMLNKLQQSARKKMIEAKTFESTQNNFADIEERKTEELYEKYTEAFVSYSELNKYLDDSIEAILFASSHSKNGNRINNASLAFGIIGTLVGIAGIVIGIIL